MRRIGMVLMVILAGGLFLGPECPPPEEPPDALEVIQAISDLHDPDYVVVRKAIDRLTWLLDAPNIWMAVRPLINIVEGNVSYHDSYTQSKAVNALTLMGTSLKGRKGRKAREAVIDALEQGRTDILRASAAKSLGLTTWEDAEQPLILALENDPSPIVRLNACEGLLMLTNGQYSSEDCHYEEGEAAAQTLSTFSAKMVQPTSRSSTQSTSSQSNMEYDLQRWAETHILLPLDNLAPVPELEE